MTLRPDGDKISVALNTLTPNFQRFEIQLEGAGWKPSAETFAWNPHPGANRLEARTVNAFGVTGPGSTAVLEVKE